MAAFSQLDVGSSYTESQYIDDDVDKVTKVSLKLKDWWSSEALYYILPNRIYFFFGANQQDSEGEEEWYMLLDLLFPTYSSNEESRGHESSPEYNLQADHDAITLPDFSSSLQGH
jgi:hypothetical protein